MKILVTAATLAFSIPAAAAVLKGVIVDNFTGRPLARTEVSLDPVPGYAGLRAAATRTDRTGQFTFPKVEPGAYLLRASRPGFATWKYGQKAWNSAGTPILVEKESAPFLDIRLRRLGAITGTVWDENDIGFAEVDVFAYRTTHPPKIVGRSRTDDRGFYRIGGLTPGEYVVRSGAKQLDDGQSILPTFGRETQQLDQAHAVDVSLEEQAPERNIRAAFGRLCRLQGTLAPAIPMRVILSSDIQELTAISTGAFKFENLPPGEYELSVASVDDTAEIGAWERLSIGKDMQIAVQAHRVESTELRYQVRLGKQPDPRTIKSFLRRKTLFGEGEARELRPGRNALLPGRWEVRVVPPPEYYVESIGSVRYPEGWAEITVSQYGGTYFPVTLSPKPALVRGVVRRSMGDPVMGAPVFLERYEPQTGKRLSAPRIEVTDTQGQFRFRGLAPGHYRVVSTFEFEHPDEKSVSAANPKSIWLQEGAEFNQDLDLWVMP